MVISERLLLRFLLILIIVTYGAIGRDLFFSRLSGASGEDFIGAILVYLRIGSSALAIVTCLFLARSLRPLALIPLLFVPYILISLASSGWTEDFKNTMRNALYLSLMMPAITMVAYRLGSKEVLRTILMLLASTLILSAIFAILVPSIGRHSASDLIQNVHAGRWRGIFGHKNGLGPHAAYGIILLWLYPQLLGNTVLLWVARVSAVLCLVFAGSATSMVGAGGMALLGGIFLLHRAAPRVAFSSVFAGSALFMLMGGALAFESGILFDLLGRDDTLTGRTLIWELAHLSIGEAPLFGYGYGSFGGTEFSSRVESYYGSIAGPESAYLNIILETGFIGALALLIPIAICMVFAFRQRAQAEGVERQVYECFILILTAALVMAFTESTPLMVTSYGGPINFTVLFCLAMQRTLPNRAGLT